MLKQNAELKNNVNALFTSDLDSAERLVVKEIENKLGKKVGEVSEKQVIDCLNVLYPNQEIGGSAGRYKEFIADLKRAYGNARTGEVRTSNF